MSTCSCIAVKSVRFRTVPVTQPTCLAANCAADFVLQQSLGLPGFFCCLVLLWMPMQLCCCASSCAVCNAASCDPSSRPSFQRCAYGPPTSHSVSWCEPTSETGTEGQGLTHNKAHSHPTHKQGQARVDLGWALLALWAHQGGSCPCTLL